MKFTYSIFPAYRLVMPHHFVTLMLANLSDFFQFLPWEIRLGDLQILGKFRFVFAAIRAIAVGTCRFRISVNLD